jgi:hypothetical protein
MRGPILHEDGFDASVRVLLTPADELLGQQVLLTLDLLVPVRRSGHHVRHRGVQPGAHGDASCDRRLHREGQRRLALRRPVEPDDDRAVLANPPKPRCPTTASCASAESDTSSAAGIPVVTCVDPAD